MSKCRTSQTIGTVEVLPYTPGVKPGSKRDALAAEAWRRVFDFFWQQKDEHLGVLREMGLTPGHMKALFVLDLDEPRPMGALAESLTCDASTVTWLVDSLEERGIVERQPLASDRRVKTVVLTPLGAKTKAELLDRIYEPPQVLRELDMKDLDTLNVVLRKLPGEGP